MKPLKAKRTITKTLSNFDDSRVKTLLVNDSNNSTNIVVKILEFATPQLAEYAEEKINDFMEINHPNLVKYLSCSSKNKKVILEEEYTSLYNLETYIKVNRLIPENMVRHFVIELCKVIDFLQKHKIFLGNELHEFNVFYGKRNLKIGDYGLEQLYELARTRQSEVPKGQKSHLQTSKFDMWKVGLMTLKIMLGTMKVQLDCKSRIQTDKWTNDIKEKLLLVPDFYGKEIVRLVTSLLSPDPEDRPYADEILQYEWIYKVIARKSIGFEKGIIDESVPTIIVSPSITSRYRTIQSAIGKARSSTAKEFVIFVLPGIYKETILIDCPVKIYGQGECVLEGAVWFRNCDAKLYGMIINNPDQNSAIDVSDGGAPRISSCCINSQGNGIFVKGSNSNPAVSNCHIYNCQQQGVEICQGARGLYYLNDIYDNLQNGILVADSKPVIKKNKLYHNASCGISLIGSESKIKTNDIFENLNFGLFSQKSKLSIMQNVIRKNRKSGLVLTDNNKGIIMDNEITQNGHAGMIIEKSSGLVDSNKIHQNITTGIMISHHSTPTVQKNIVYNNNNNGIEILEASEPILVKNTVHSNYGCGILVASQSSASIRLNFIYSNQNQGLSVSSNGSTTISDNIVSEEKNTGILVLAGGACIINDNSIKNCGKNGIEIKDKDTNVDLIRNKIVDCGGCGVSVHDKALCNMKSNEVQGSNFDNIQVWNSAQCFVEDDTFTEANGRGVNVFLNGTLQGAFGNDAQNNRWPDMIASKQQ